MRAKRLRQKLFSRLTFYSLKPSNYSNFFHWFTWNSQTNTTEPASQMTNIPDDASKGSGRSVSSAEKALPPLPPPPPPVAIARNLTRTNSSAQTRPQSVLPWMPINGEKLINREDSSLQIHNKSSSFFIIFSICVYFFFICLRWTYLLWDHLRHARQQRHSRKTVYQQF